MGAFSLPREFDRIQLFMALSGPLRMRNGHHAEFQVDKILATGDTAIDVNLPFGGLVIGHF